MHAWATELYPLHRSLTGPGNRATLDYLGELLPSMRRHRVVSGTRAFDWTVPDEWQFNRAFVEDDRGERLIDTGLHNLHVVGYSEPIDAWMTIAELDEHIHSMPDKPTWIPYVTSYYQRRWGFCITHTQREQLRQEPKRRVHVVIDAALGPGFLEYADLVVPGECRDEVLFSTYVCHPSMANNELSGPVVQTALARWVQTLPSRRLTYRFVFVPETIGSLVYLSEHLGHMRGHTRAGFVVTCVGDERTFSYLESRQGDTLADRAARHVLGNLIGDYRAYSFLARGSDERQYCAPGIDLPVCSVMRSKYGTYPEYHTSADDLSLITARGLGESLAVYQAIVTLLEANVQYRVATLGEPQLGPRGLYPTLSKRGSAATTRTLLDVLAYADGTRDLISLAESIGVSALAIIPIVKRLHKEGLLVEES